METVTLYPPAGQKEFELVATSGHKAFPPRLEEQPFFYPVLTREYAEQIARDWNTRDERSGFVGYVLQFEVDAAYIARFEIQKVGAKGHLEYWIPANELHEFNQHIVGQIRIIAQFPESPA